MGSEWSRRRAQQRGRVVLRGAAPEVATPWAWSFAPLLDGVPVTAEMRSGIKEEHRKFIADAKGVGGHGDLEYLCRLAIQRYVALARQYDDVEHERAWTSVLCGEDPDRPHFALAETRPRMLSLGERRLGRVGAF